MTVARPEAACAPRTPLADHYRRFQAEAAELLGIEK